MNEFVSYCSPALLARLAGAAASGDNVVSLAEARIAREVAKLPALQARILRWRFGVGCEPLSEEEIAERLRLSLVEVEKIGDEALVELGLALVELQPAA